MKKNIKLIIFWVVSLSLFISAGVASLFFPGWLSGVQGLFIIFFLGYCGIIVVAQAFAFIEVIRSQRENASQEKQRYYTEIESA